MPLAIRPLTTGDIPELSRFLTEGFHAPAGAPFAAEDVLRWKYFDPLGPEAEGIIRSELARDSESGQVVGHVGICPVRFRGIGLPSDGIPALHGIDWLGSEAMPGVGARLLWKWHKRIEVGYVIVATEIARLVTGRAGYEVVAKVPVYRNVLNPGYRLRLPGIGPAARLARAVSDTASKLARPGQKPRRSVEIEPVESFGDEIRPILASHESRSVMTSRDPGLLNHLMRYPRGGISGWRLVCEGVVRGFAILSVVPREGTIREGRIVESLVDGDDPDLWHGSIFALTSELKRQGADVAVGFASTPLTAQALARSGYAPAYELEFTLRDRGGRIPRNSPFHLTSIEADYACT